MMCAGKINNTIFTVSDAAEAKEKYEHRGDTNFSIYTSICNGSDLLNCNHNSVVLFTVLHPVQSISY
jgi:hypothetical protein